MTNYLQRQKSVISTETCYIEQLPDAVLLLILSFIPTLADIARTSILSRRWRNLWHGATASLDFDATTILPMELLETSHHWYIAWVNKVINARAAIPHLPFVKEVKIRYELNAGDARQIDHWIDFAIANRVETLHLELGPYLGLVHPSYQYELSEASWLRAPSGLSSLKCLKSLFLFCVKISQQSIDFILSSCPLLEDFTLNFSGSHCRLDVSGMPRLKRLKIDTDDVLLDKLCAPYLTSFFCQSIFFKPRRIDVPMLNDLTIGSNLPSQPIINYLQHFWTYLPQLEKLELVMRKPKEFESFRLPELVKLKYLKICVDWITDLFFCQIIKFINSCPLLEIFSLEIRGGNVIPRRRLMNRHTREQQELWREVEASCSFKCLKVLELYGIDGKTLELELVKCILRRASNMEKLFINLDTAGMYDKFFPSNTVMKKVVKEKAEELCREIHLEIEITVVG